VIVVAHPRVAADADPSTSDVLDQVELVTGALAALGERFETVAVDGGRVWEALAPRPGVVVFNLLEAPPGSPQLQTAATAALELLGLPFTGAAAGPMWLSTDKLATRALLASAGLPVAAGGRFEPERPALLDVVPPPWILKPAYEDASLGLEGDPVCATVAQAVARGRDLAARFPGQPIVLEHFLPGREFNVALLEDAAGVEVLPVAEIAFVDFPPGTPALVGYEAKWQTGSFEYEHTVRRFPSPEVEAALLDELAGLARSAWRACGLAGYGRVDLRLDESGRPHVLEVNANPCLSADAGFMAAAGRAGLDAAAVVARIVAAARRRGGRPGRG
jgi:D-alanine-D-alanine ligase